jgi:hypothetical protein
MRFAALVLLSALALSAQTPCAGIPAYQTCDIVFELSAQASAAHPDPYKTVDLKAEFRSPRHRTMAMPAFWDGGRRLVIRFAPTEAGDWDYRVTSNVKEFDGKTDKFAAAAATSPGFIRAANVHHWAYTERDARGLDQAHLWMGSTDLRFAFLDDAAFRSLADARAAQKFNHMRGWIMDGASDAAYSGPDAPKLDQFRRLDDRIRYLNSKGITADLILAAGNNTLPKLFPNWEQRQRFVRYLVARYGASNVTWQGLQFFEDDLDARALLKEIGGLLKQFDPYQHPRTSGARITSGPLLDDGWADFASYGSHDSQVAAIEHQIHAVPQVQSDLKDDADAATFRKRLWNATMDGQYVTYSGGGANVKAMAVWFDFFNDTRHWELEPYFDVDGGRALALEDTEYVVYIEKPGPLELTVEKHGYDLYWINPATGESTKGKFKGEHFTGEAPDRSHDWILHVVREGRLEGMNKSFKFESRDIVMQEVEANTPKVPFTIEQPVQDPSVRVPPPFAAKITRETRATRSMMWLWTGDVSADGQGYRVLATGSKGTMRPFTGIAKNFPATMHLRLYGMNANGKVYAIDRALTINP